MSSSDGLSNLSGLRISTQIEQEVEQVLKAANVEPGLPVLPEKIGVSKEGNVKITTNVYPIKMGHIPVYRYDVKMSAELRKQDGSMKHVDLTKKTRGDSVTVDRRDRCRDIFILFGKVHSVFLKGSKCVYYDLQSILYSLSKLDVSDNGEKFSISPKDLGKNFEVFYSVDIEIKKVTDEFVLTLGDMSSGVSRNLSEVSNSLVQYLDIATSQNILFNPQEHISFSSHTSFFYNHVNYGFRDDDSAYFEDNGSYLAIGAEKSVRFVEGSQPKAGPNAALIVESKKTPFHVVESVLNKAKRMVRDIQNIKNGDVEKLNKNFLGLRVETKHLGRYQRFDIKGIDRETPKTKIINVDNQKMSVDQYFKKKHTITLKEPNTPLIKARGKDHSISYFPMELCFLCDNQRIKTNQQTSKMVQAMIKKCAVPPSILKSQISNTFNALQLQNNEYLKNAGVEVSSQPLTIMARYLDAPELEYKDFTDKANPMNGTWKGRGFLIPAVCKKWQASAFLGPRDRLQEKEFNTFLNRFVVDAANRGIRIGNPATVQVFSADLREVDKQIENSAKNGCGFFLAIHSDAADDVHNSIKLAEQKYGIVTQALRFGTYMNMVIKGQPMTLSNVVNKTNIKLGGLNFSLSFNSPGAKEVLGTNTLYIGFGMNHPGGGLGGLDADAAEDKSGSSKGKVPAPSIVGYAANYGLAHEFEFIGDFIFQQPRREEKVDIIRTVVERCVQKYRENRKNEPKRILIFRNGCSEGQFQHVLKYEIPLISMALVKVKCNAKITVVVPNKLQSVRFFNANMNSRDKPADQNIKPGLVVDKNVVHPIFPEFYLNSHRALQGTAKTPKYTLLHDDNKLPLEVIQRITYLLCYGHQIVFMPVSLPSPVYIANRYAERGRKLYMRWVNSMTSDHSGIDYPQMTETLGYYGKKALENRRINA